MARAVRESNASSGLSGLVNSSGSVGAVAMYGLDLTMIGAVATAVALADLLELAFSQWPKVKPSTVRPPQSIATVRLCN